MAKRTESCGRCSVTTVLDATEAVDGDDEHGGGRNPFDGPRIEVPEDDLRRASFVAVWLGRLKARLDAAAHRLTYGR
ncbi:hypothetical protein [Halovivax sp.]|uniref:hypothetical protein n=1 Tax=Halovivax sp. TaxID=1935978 RepID=UPI0025BE938F|nr:hypothetical protein [Halovivax sp.]